MAKGAALTLFTESTVEDAALEISAGLGYTILHGPTIAPGEMFGTSSPLTMANTSGTILTPESLRSDAVHLRTGTPFVFLPELAFAFTPIPTGTTSYPNKPKNWGSGIRQPESTPS